MPLMIALDLGLNPHVQHSSLQANVVVCYVVIGIILLHSIYRMYWFRVYIDELTGIPNRRALDEHLTFLERDYTIAMVDIDHFKSFNDRFGHDEGDNVLRMVAKTLDTSSSHRAYRYGGEEFCIVFENIDAEDSAPQAEKIRKAVEQREFYIRAATGKPSKKSTRVSDKKRFKWSLKALKKSKKTTRKKQSSSKNVKVTISIGLANPNPDSRDAMAVIKNADKALYQAKKAGRNCVEIASQ